MSDFSTKKIDLCGSVLSPQDSDAIGEIIYEVLMEKFGIFTEGFSWSINVEYEPQRDLL